MNRPIRTEADRKREERMQKIIDKDLEIGKRLLDRDNAMNQRFADQSKRKIEKNQAKLKAMQQLKQANPQIADLVSTIIDN